MQQRSDFRSPLLRHSFTTERIALEHASIGDIVVQLPVYSPSLHLLRFLVIITVLEGERIGASTSVLGRVV